MDNKEDHLWIKWVHHVYLKQIDWFDYSPSVESSWSWRKICAVKEKFKAVLSGSQLTDFGAGYTIKLGYKALIAESASPVWAKRIWSRLVYPRHSFITWLSVQDRLFTKSRMHRLGIATDLARAICGGGVETWSHLILDCRLVLLCRGALKMWCGLDLNGCNVWHQRSYGSAWSLVQKLVACACCAGLCYHIWVARNWAKVEGLVSIPAAIVQTIKKEVLFRIQHMVRDVNTRD